MKNYTSTVAVETTVLRIEKALVKHGASHIAKEYKDGEVAGLSFRITLPAGQEVQVKLPANTESVFAVFSKDKYLTDFGKKRLQAQARRTAWKIVQDLVEVQLSMVEMQQAEFAQIFLPYIHDGRRTFYEAIKGDNFKMLALPAGKPGDREIP